MIDLREILSAQRRIVSYIRRTPILTLEPSFLNTSEPITIKLENLQNTGSFQIRGICNEVLTRVAQANGPVTTITVASTGNAGIATAAMAKKLGLHAKVYLPDSADPFKIRQISNWGGTPIIAGSSYTLAEEAASRNASASDTILVRPYEDPDLLAGHGTIGVELIEQSGAHFDTVLIPVGGGGLLAGMTAALDDLTKVVAVESEHSAKLASSRDNETPEIAQASDPREDSFGVPRIGRLALNAATHSNVMPITVPHESIETARSLLWKRANLAVEHTAAATIAALLVGRYQPEHGETVAVVLTGANTERLAQEK
jgi:threonine dehydratase